MKFSFNKTGICLKWYREHDTMEMSVSIDDGSLKDMKPFTNYSARRMECCFFANGSYVPIQTVYPDDIELAEIIIQFKAGVYPKQKD